MMERRKSRIRVFPSDLWIAFWVGFGTCGALVLFVLWAVNNNA